MIKICFVCTGNICRSPMAEYIMKDTLKKMYKGEKFALSSRATTYAEDGHDIYSKAKQVLDKYHIKYNIHHSKRVEKHDYEIYDYFVCMDDNSVNKLLNIVDDKDKKVRKLLDRDIADPMETGDFETTFKDIYEGTTKLINELL